MPESEVEEDCLKLMRVTCSDIFKNVIFKTYVELFKWTKWLLLICTTYSILKSFDFQNFLDFVPYAGLGTYGISVMIQVLEHSFLNKETQKGFFSLKSAKSEVATEIRRQAFRLQTWYCLQTLFGLYVGILHNIPNETLDRKFFYFYNFLQNHPFRGSQVLGVIYKLTMIPFMHIISSGSYQGIYFMQHLTYQFLILEDHFKELIALDQDKDLDQISNDEEYQTRVNIQFKNNIMKYEELLQRGLELNAQLGIFILTGAITYIIGGAALIIYVYSGVIEQNTLRPISVLILFVSSLSALMVAGQILEDQTKSLCETTFKLPWYVWNRETVNVYKVFLPMVQRSFTLRFSLTMGLNYTLGMAIFKVVYQCASIVSQMK